jgi:hypothetical protein
MTDDAIRRHEEEWHSTVEAGDIAEMVVEHQKLVALGPDISMMIEDFYGELKPIVGDPDHREGGRLDRYDAAAARVENGGVGLHLSPGAWLAITALITTLGAIAIALLGIAFGSS